MFRTCAKISKYGIFGTLQWTYLSLSQRYPKRVLSCFVICWSKPHKNTFAFRQKWRVEQFLLSSCRLICLKAAWTHFAWSQIPSRPSSRGLLCRSSKSFFSPALFFSFFFMAEIAKVRSFSGFHWELFSPEGEHKSLLLPSSIELSVNLQVSLLCSYSTWQISVVNYGCC